MGSRQAPCGEEDSQEGNRTEAAQRLGAWACRFSPELVARVAELAGLRGGRLDRVVECEPGFACGERAGGPVRHGAVGYVHVCGLRGLGVGFVFELVAGGWARGFGWSAGRALGRSSGVWRWAAVSAAWTAALWSRK